MGETQINTSSITTSNPPEQKLTQEMLEGWYRGLVWQVPDSYWDKHYSIEVQGNAWRKACKMMDKRMMSKRARRLLRNRRKMK